MGRFGYEHNKITRLTTISRKRNVPDIKALPFISCHIKSVSQETWKRSRFLVNPSGEQMAAFLVPLPSGTQKQSRYSHY